LSAIKSGDVRMLPRWYFGLRAVLIGTGGTFLIFVTLYAGSFVAFTMHGTGSWLALADGPSGLRFFLTTVPWVLVALSLLFILVLEVLVRHYSFAYRAPLLVSLLVIL